MEVSTKYKKIFEDKSRVKNIVKNIGLPEQAFGMISEISNQCTDYLINMWNNGEKTMRTGYVMEAMGKYYPKSEGVIESSILTDSIINNLDEIYDENLKKDKRTPHIVELIKEIGKITEASNITEKHREIIGRYFDKILVVAGGEVVYSNQIESTEDEEKILNLGKKYYDSRIIDMDVYMELPVYEMGYKDDEIDKIVKVARNFRAINLIKKDLKDIPEDIENNIKSLFTIVKNRNMNPKKFAKKIAESYLKEFDKIKFNDDILREIKNNFYEMGKKEIESV